MTRHHTIVAGHGTRKRSIRVERKRRRHPWSRRDVHAIGLAAVADELDQAAMLDLGGIMTGERRAMLAERRRAAAAVIPTGDRTSASVEQRDIGCAAPEATRPEILPDLSTAGALLSDVRRLFARWPGRCPPEFYQARTR